MCQSGFHNRYDTALQYNHSLCKILSLTMIPSFNVGQDNFPTDRILCLIYEAAYSVITWYLQGVMLT